MRHATKKLSCMLAVLMALAFILQGCSPDEPNPKAASRTESAKTEASGLNIEISQPQFDQSKQAPQIGLPKKRDSSLDF